MPDVLTLCSDEVDDLLALEDGLTDWEVGFVQRMREEIDARRMIGDSLTPSQAAKIHEIWDRRCR